MLKDCIAFQKDEQVIEIELQTGENIQTAGQPQGVFKPPSLRNLFRSQCCMRSPPLHSCLAYWHINPNLQ